MDERQDPVPLRFDQATLRALLEAIPDATAILARDGTLIDCNQVTAARLGVPIEQFRGSYAYAALPPDVARTRLELVDEVFRTGAPKRFTDVRDDLEIRHVFMPLPDGKGGVAAVVTVSTDVTAFKSAQRAVADSEARFRTFVEQAPIGIGVAREGRVVFSNPRRARMFGYETSAELIGRSILDSVAPEARAEIAERNRKREAGEQVPTDYQTIGLCRDGTKFPLRVRAVRTELSDGPATLLFTDDLTAQQEAGEALRSSEGRYRTLAEASSDCILTMNLDLRLMYINRAGAAMVGLRPEDVIGRPILDLVHPEAAPVIRKQVQEALQVGRPINRVAQAPLGGRLRWMDASVVPLAKGDGQFDGLLVVARDVTDRMTSDQRYGAILQTAIDGFWINDQDGRIVEVNDAYCRMSGYTREELLGMTIADVEALEDADETRRHAQRIAALGGERFESKQRRKDGSIFDVEVSAQPLPFEGKRNVAFFHDTSEKSRLVRELKRSNAELAQFAYSASHDLQEPARMVASYAQLLSRRYKGRLDADADEFIRFAAEGAIRLHRMIQDLLEYSRAGTQMLALEPVDLNEVLGDVLKNLDLAIREGGVRVEVEPLPWVAGDRTRLGQLFQNLLDNAIKFHGSEDPHVRVQAWRGEDGLAHFAVADNGIGIEPAYFGRIFELFRRLHTSEQYPGTGIGLALCKRIVDAHGGRIRVESEPGHGTTFRFTLPLPPEGE